MCADRGSGRGLGNTVDEGILDKAAANHLIADASAFDFSVLAIELTEIFNEWIAHRKDHDNRGVPRRETCRCKRFTKRAVSSPEIQRIILTCGNLGWPATAQNRPAVKGDH